MSLPRFLDDVRTSNPCPEAGLSCLRSDDSWRVASRAWTDKLVYVLLMGTCILLILLAWNVVRFWSTTAAVVMSVVAAVIPPIAVVVGNWGQDRQ